MISCGITKVIPKETVILSSRAPIGYVGLTQSISWHSQGIKGFINKKPNLINNYYFYFWCLKNTQLFINKATSTIFLEISSSTIKTIEVNLPPLATQQQIIDLIAPLEVLQEKVKKIADKIVKLLINLYKLNPNTLISFKNMITLINSPYQTQKKYFATNAVKNMIIDSSKVIDLKNLSKIPSRANLTPQANSFIFSKMVGENKIYYFDQQPKEVFSTGFFNFQTPYCDHVLGFLLSKDFIQQKRMLVTGTMMAALTNGSLNQIQLKKSESMVNTFSILLNKLNIQIQNIEQLRLKAINLLIE